MIETPFHLLFTEGLKATLRTEAGAKFAVSASLGERLVRDRLFNQDAPDKIIARRLKQSF